MGMLDKPVVHVRIQQIFGKKKVTTISGIGEFLQHEEEVNRELSNQQAKDDGYETDEQKKETDNEENGKIEHDESKLESEDAKSDEMHEKNSQISIPSPEKNPVTTQKKESKKQKTGNSKFKSLEDLLSKLKKKFNCGGHIAKKEEVVTLQGDYSYNVKEILQAYLGKGRDRCPR